jgi:hypothetical protein
MKNPASVAVVPPLCLRIGFFGPSLWHRYAFGLTSAEVV